MTNNEFDQLRLLFAIVAALGLTVAAGGGIATVSAATDDSVLTNIVNGEDDGYLTFARGWASGFKQSITTSVFGSESWSADGVASDLRADVAGNASAYQTWLNDRLDASTDRNVVKVRVRNETATETLFLVADVNGSNYENVTAVRSTSRTVDETCTLSGEAGRNAPDELETFRTDYVEPNKDVSKKFTGRLAGAYRSGVNCTFLED